jgi:hypothetical protein
LRCGLRSIAASRLTLDDVSGNFLYFDRFPDCSAIPWFGCLAIPWCGDRGAEFFSEQRSSAAEILQHLGFDVAAGDYGYVQLCFWELVGAEEESGGGDCTAGFSHGFGIRGEKF